MVKRIAVVPLWFVSTWLTYGLIAYFVGVSDSGGAILGALIAALVWMDPAGSFWGPKAQCGRTVSGEASPTAPAAVASR